MFVNFHNFLNFYNLLFKVNFRIENHKISLQDLIRIALNTCNLRPIIFMLLNCLSHAHYFLHLFSFLSCSSMFLSFLHEDSAYSLLDVFLSTFYFSFLLEKGSFDLFHFLFFQNVIDIFMLIFQPPTNFNKFLLFLRIYSYIIFCSSRQ